MNRDKLLLALLPFLLLFVGLVDLSRGYNDEVIDLQDLLRNVDTTMKDLKRVMRTCNSTVKNAGKVKPRDCADLWDSGIKNNGIYRVWPEKWEKVGSFEVYCDMITDGGGWTVFQTRGDYKLPHDYFYKTWSEYKNGFGDLNKEFWLGNDRIFVLSNQDSYELRIDMWDMDLNRAYAKYNKFWIENEDQQYRLRLAGYTGDVGDSLSYVSGLPFTTKDRKNDLRPGNENCAQVYKGAWWYANCHLSNLNGLNFRGPQKSHADGINWKTWKDYEYSLAATEMKMRPVDFLRR